MCNGGSDGVFLQIGMTTIRIGYVYQKFVLAGLLEDLLTAPLKDSSLQMRAARILCSIHTLREEDFPEDLKEYWRKLVAIGLRPTNPHLARLSGALPPHRLCAMDLTRKEAREVLRAYVRIIIGITRKIGQL